VTDDTLTCDNHIDQIISRLNCACFALTALKAMLLRKAFRMLYFTFVHSVVSCSIIFGATPLILWKYSEWKFYFSIVSINYLFYCMWWTTNINLEKNLEVHNKNISCANNFHLPFTNWTKYQTGAHCAGIKICNNLPTYIKFVANEIWIIRLALKRFLLSKSFCSFEKYFNCNKLYICQIFIFECYNYYYLCNHCIVIVFLIWQL